jgi:hypothetical protein
MYPFLFYNFWNGGRTSRTNELSDPVAILAYGERWMKKKIDLSELVKLRESGLTMKAIAARLGVGKTSVVMALKNAKGGRDAN